MCPTVKILSSSLNGLTTLSSSSTTTLLLKAWSIDQQHQHHLGVHRNQELWIQSQTHCIRIEILNNIFSWLTAHDTLEALHYIIYYPSFLCSQNLYLKWILPIDSKSYSVSPIKWTKRKNTYNYTFPLNHEPFSSVTERQFTQHFFI